MESERCKACNATRITQAHLDKTPRLFDQRWVVTCLRCGTEGGSELQERVNLCDVCEEPLTYDSEVRISLHGVACNVEVRVHPLCVIQVVPKLLPQMSEAVTRARESMLTNAYDSSWDAFDLEKEKRT